MNKRIAKKVSKKNSPVIKVTSFEQLNNLVLGDLTFEMVKNERFYLVNGGWTAIELSMEMWLQACTEVTDNLGGRKYDTLLSKIKYVKSHWSYRRFTYEKCTNRFEYTTGQCCTTEKGQIRKELYKM